MLKMPGWRALRHYPAARELGPPSREACARSALRGSAATDVGGCGEAFCDGYRLAAIVNQIAGDRFNPERNLHIEQPFESLARGILEPHDN
jgi:hypothetical protein